MLDRAWGGSFRLSRDGRLHPQEGRPRSRLARKPRVECLEGRQLLAASIATIPDVTVAANQGIQVPINGSGSGGQAQTFTVTSSNSAINATIAQGEFITLNVTHTSSGGTDKSFSGPITFQVFSDLTPNTAAAFVQYVQQNLFNNTKFFRILAGNPSVIQGGPQPGSGTRPQEFNQQLAFNGIGTVAVANAGPNTDGQEFFITNGPVPSYTYNYTDFGQVVAGEDIAMDIGNVALNPASPGTTPLSPVTITSATVSPTDPNGVIHIDTVGAAAGQTAKITVTAHDPTDNTTAMQSFNVTTTTAATIPATATFAPTTLTPTPSSLAVGENKSTTFTANYTSNIPAGNTTTTTALTLVTPPAHGKVTFNGMTGTYTPTAGYTGADTFSYAAVNTNTATGANPTSATGNAVTLGTTVVATGTPITGQPNPNPLTVVQGHAGTFTATYDPNLAPNAPATTTANMLVTPPAHGTVTFNGTTGVYTADAGYNGPDSFSYQAVNTSSAGTVAGSTVTESVDVSPVLVAPTTGTPSPAQLTASAPNTPITFSAPYTSNEPAGSTTITTANMLTKAPAHGTVTFNGQTGTYTPSPGFTGYDTFSYAAVNTNTAQGANPRSLSGSTVTVPVSILVNTQAVRVIGNVLVVTPPPTTLKATNTIVVSVLTNTVTNTPTLAVSLNGNVDSTTIPSTVNQVIVFGGKENDNITVAPDVPSTITVELDGGHGGKNVVQAGSGETLMQGWFGKTTLIGGTGPNQMFGATGHVRFKPTSSTTEIAAVTPHPGYYNYRSYHGRVSYSIQPPTGTFYKYVNGHLVRIASPRATRKA